MRTLSLLLLAALAACSTTSPSTTPPPPPTAMAAPAGIPMGVYTVTLTDADIPPAATPEARAALVGTWEMAVDGPGHAMVSFNGRQVVDAPFQVQGNQITFLDDSGEYACHTAGARYTWEMTAAGLRFTRVEDACTGRMAALVTHPWVKRP